MKKVLSLLLVIILTCACFSGALADSGRWVTIWVPDGTGIGSSGSNDWSNSWSSGDNSWSSGNDSWSSGSWNDYVPGTGSSYSVTGSTSLTYASSAQQTNIGIAVGKLSSINLAYGDTFSFNELVGPRTASYGYKDAVNGRGVRVRGGGVGQVATTLYLAVKQLSGITYNELSTWDDKFAQRYTAYGTDAVIVDYANKRDFSFTNYAGDLHIEMWVSRSNVYCTITVNPSGTLAAGSMIGYASLPLSGTNTLKNNVKLASSAIDGVQLNYYDEFSFNQLVGPRTEKYGFGAAINGRGVRVIGGGVAQAASAVYVAIKDLSCIKVLEKRTYDKNYNQSYVQDAADAIVTDYNAGHDFRFRYTGYGTLTVNVYVNADQTRLICEVYEKK